MEFFLGFGKVVQWDVFLPVYILVMYKGVSMAKGTSFYVLPANADVDPTGKHLRPGKYLS